MSNLACAVVVAAVAPWSLAGQGTEMVRVSVTVPPVVALSPVTAAVEFAAPDDAEAWVAGRSHVALNHTGNIGRVLEVRGFRVVGSPMGRQVVPVELQVRIDDGPWVTVQGDTPVGSVHRGVRRGTVAAHHRIRGSEGPLPQGDWEVEVQYRVRAGAEP